LDQINAYPKGKWYCVLLKKTSRQTAGNIKSMNEPMEIRSVKTGKGV